MVVLSEVVDYLNDYLEVSNFVDDFSLNGLQVEAGTGVEKIAFAVDACTETKQGQI